MKSMANVHLNGISSRVTILNKAVGAQDGSGSLVVGNTSAINSVSISDNAGSSVEIISMESLLDLVGARVNLMKIDCEGAEYAFFDSAPEYAFHCIDCIVAEAHSLGSERHSRLMNQLAEFGFHVRERDKGRQLGTFIAQPKMSAL